MTDTTATTEVETALRELAERHGITLMCDSQAALPPALLMLVAATSGCSTVAEAACRHIHFFAGHEQAQAYLESNPALEGEVYDQATSVEVGRIVFGSLLAERKG